MSGDAGTLYPFLSGGGPSDEDRAASVVAAVETKAAESRALRARMLAEHADALRACATALRGAGRRFTLGNGGSAADAAIAAALLDAHDLAQPVTVLTALANDVGVDHVFARQIDALGRAGDCVIACSTSGTSANVVRALQRARTGGMVTVALTGGVPADTETFVQADHLFAVPSDSVHRIQEVHMTLIGELVRLCAT